jgi:hypothetical protein
MIILAVATMEETRMQTSSDLITINLAVKILAGSCGLLFMTLWVSASLSACCVFFRFFLQLQQHDYHSGDKD